MMPSTKADSEMLAPAAKRDTEASAGLPLIVVDRSKMPDGSRTVRKRSLVKHLKFLPVLALVVATSGIVALYFQPPGLKLLMRTLNLEPGAGTSNPIAVPARPDAIGNSAARGVLPGQATAQSVVVGLGKLIPSGDIVTVAPPFGSGDARIASLAVEEGDIVERGYLLAILDNEGSLKAAVDSAEATVASRQAAVRQARENVEASREEAAASLSRAQALVVSTERDFERTQTLKERGFATDATLDAKRTAYEQAVQDVVRAKATLSRYTFDTIDSQVDVAVAARALDAARADLARARAELEKAYVRAPSAGTILTIHVRPGGKPGAEGILTFGDIAQMTAEVEVYQTAIRDVTLGDPVTLSADALPRKLEGTVSRIGLEVGQQTLTDATPAANTDARVVKVHVSLTPESIEVARRFTNLQVTARIEKGVAQ